MTPGHLPNAIPARFLLLILWIGLESLHAASGTRESVLPETLEPYTGPSVRGVDTSTLSNKVMCGHQGWFNAEGDDAERGWIHWTQRRGPMGPGNAKVDLWPDVSELGAEERFGTGFTNARGRPLEVFSSFPQPTVLRHFQWLRDYEIDGVFVPRFASDLGDPRALRLKGRFLWSQFVAARRAGATMSYVAMFDEVDEGTAIFKGANDVPPPTATNKFLTYEGLPADFYLRLTGQGARLLRGGLPLSDAMPTTTRAFPAYRRPVMTWVPPYAVRQSQARLAESFGGLGMKDALTHLGLQFWTPADDGGLARAGRTNEVNDNAITELREWGHTNGVRVLLCVFNAVNGVWDWPRARKCFAEHPDRFIDALVAEVDRLQLDGVDVDLEGTGSFEADRGAYVAFIRRLAARMRAQGRQLTVDTFSYHWHAPNQTWWPDLLPHVDALTTMGYEEIGAHAPEWRSYAAQLAAAGDHAAKLMIGLPAGRDEWRGNRTREHLQWLQTDGRAGVSFWDAQVTGSSWRQAEVWKAIGAVRGRR